jgi:HPt (histidine-containing phosphotransfer) domain-containing protein
MGGDRDLEAHLAALREKFRLSLTSYRDRLTEARNRFVASTDGDAVRRLKGIAHELAGAAGMFGYPDVSEVALELEAAADTVLMDEGERSTIIAPLRRLIREIDLSA